MTIGSILWIIGAIAAFIAGIMILIDAFKLETTQGLLCLFVPFYAFYYLFAKYTNEGNKKTVMLLFFGGMGILIIGAIMTFAGAASSMANMKGLKFK